MRAWLILVSVLSESCFLTDNILLTHFQTMVTVNTVFEDLALNKGAVSNAILGVAGPKLQEVVNAKNASGNIGEVIVTDGCELKSKLVFHAVTPHWDKGQGNADKVVCLFWIWWKVKTHHKEYTSDICNTNLYNTRRNAFMCCLLRSQGLVNGCKLSMSCT